MDQRKVLGPEALSSAAARLSPLGPLGMPEVTSKHCIGSEKVAYVARVHPDCLLRQVCLTGVDTSATTLKGRFTLAAKKQQTLVVFDETFDAHFRHS
jgi:hypothetical protein